MKRLHHITMGNSKFEHTVNIVDLLEVDICRKAILDYVDFVDVMRSETVCRRWQRVVREYLEQRRSLTLVLDINRTPSNVISKYALRQKLAQIFPWYCHTWNIHDRTLNVNAFESISTYTGINKIDAIKKPWKITLRRAVEKFGPYIVSLSTNQRNVSFYRNIHIHCPHLRKIQLKCAPLRDDKIVEVLQNTDWEEIMIVEDENVTGQFLNSIKLNNLKSLSLIKCRALDMVYLNSVAFYLKNVTNLDLGFNNEEILINLHVLLDKMPQLENISLEETGIYRGREQKFRVSSELIESFSRVTHLKRLDLKWGYWMTDDFLEMLAKHKQLEYLSIPAQMIRNCFRGVAALICRLPLEVPSCLCLNWANGWFRDKFAELEAFTSGKVTKNMLDEAIRTHKVQWYVGFNVKLECAAHSAVETKPKIKIMVTNWKDVL